MKSIYTVGPVSVANNDSLELRPGTSDFLLINTISYGGAVELYVSDGDSSNLLVDSAARNGTWTSLVYYATFHHYYKVKNVSGGAILISADGLVL